MGWSGGRKGKREVIISELKDMLKKENYWSIFGFCFFFKKKGGCTILMLLYKCRSMQRYKNTVGKFFTAQATSERNVRTQ